MSKFGDQLRGIGIHNTHDLLIEFGEKGRDVAVSYTSAEGRMVRASGTSVFSPTFKTDPTAGWYNYGNKTFVGLRSESLEVTKKWASEKYGIEEWKPCPLIRGDYIPVYVFEAAKKAVK